MARMGARWTRFFARGKVFKHFWQGTEVVSVDATAPGAVVTVATSLLPGAASGSATASGSTLGIAEWLVPGVATGDATAHGALLVARIGLLPGSASADSRTRRFTGGTVIERRRGRDAVACGAVVCASVTLVPGMAWAGPDEDDYDLLDLAAWGLI